MAIFKNCDLVRVSKGQIYKRKYRFIGLLTYERPNHKGFSVGTAFLISPRIIITASHNVYSLRDFCMYTNYRFYPAASGICERYINIVDIKFPNEYRTSLKQHSPYYNYCILVLEEPVHYQSYAPLCINFGTYYQGQLSVTGYRGDAIQYADKEGKSLMTQMFTLGDKKFSVQQDIGMIFHQISTQLGQSGSPMTIRIAYQEDLPVIVGLHLGHSTQRKSNYGRLITIDIVQKLLEWIQDSRQIELIQIFDLKSMKMWDERQKFQCLNRGKIISLYKSVQRLRPQVEEYQIKSASLKNPRLHGYIDFRISQRYYEFITVNGVRLYYELYSSRVYLVEDIMEQYFYVTGKHMNLENEYLIIKERMPIFWFIQQPKDKQQFQKTLNIMNDPKTYELLQAKYNLKQHDLMQRSTNNSISELGYQNYTFETGKYTIIALKNGQTKILSFEGDAEFTMNRLVNLAKKKLNIHSSQFQIRYKNTEIFSQRDYDQTFQDLDVQEKTFEIHFYNEKCYFSPTMKVRLIPTPKLARDQYGFPEEKKQILIEQLDVKKDSLVLIYDYSKNKFDSGAVLGKTLSKQIGSFYHLEYTNGTNICHLQCTKDVLVKNSKNEWISIENIKEGTQIQGLQNKQYNKIISYTLLSKKLIESKQPRTFYSLSIQGHNFVGNNLILHNQNQFRLKVSNVRENQIKEDVIEVYSNKKIKDIFPNQKVYLGGSQLNCDLTFGDYQLYNVQQIYVYPNRNNNLEQNIKLAITEWKNKTQEYQQSEDGQKVKWETHCLGIYGNKIIPVEQSLKREIPSHNINPNVIVGQRIFLDRMNFIEKIEQMTAIEENILSEQKQLRNNKYFKEIKARQKKLTQKDILPIFMYTCPNPPINKDINEQLRRHELFSRNRQNEKLYALAGIIFKSLMKLPRLAREVTVYRGVADLVGKVFRDNIGKVIIFQGFTSTSKNKNIAEIYASDNGVIFQIQTITGRNVTPFSPIQDQQEILISPFSCFLIESFKMENSRSIVKIKEIPQPCTNKDKLVFWVDDNPDNNTRLIESLGKEIEVIQVLSTRVMKTILRDFFWIYRFLQKKVLIISDMVREEDQNLNFEAGVDIFDLVYNEYGFSSKTIIYSSDPSSVKKVITKRNINSKNWELLSSEEDLIYRVKKEVTK